MRGLATIVWANTVPSSVGAIVRTIVAVSDTLPIDRAIDRPNDAAIVGSSDTPIDRASV